MHGPLNVKKECQNNTFHTYIRTSIMLWTVPKYIRTAMRPHRHK